MPRAKSICLYKGCLTPTVQDGRCGEHQLRKSWNRTSARNASRPRDWSKRRARTLVRDRFTCQQCGARKELEVDHIVPVARGGSWEPDNLWVLCKPCHKRKTYSEGR
ncbi:HNH endonuclease [Streptomyces sp. NBC_01751]|uniref:HNH endonuclease n=1 Tax=Streptomyces sp. NBC_01751 TaxID=2975929 RepID=UPI002DDB1214|nr:HNH endonuclease [Streptomyces sp. NBC_01751]WSD24539.1 HNH endonuclease [Streptomyces sp. NBC_01751]